jgi:hypothetical protein
LTDENHECDKNDIESVKCIKKDCKLCPGCGAQSQKIDGCPQVWCIVCKKAWNWNTGKIETGNIHSPDYYKFMRNNGLEIAPVNPQNNCVPFDVFRETRRLKQARLADTKEIDTIKEYWRKTDHYDYNYNRLVANNEYLPEKNKDLRIHYLKNEMTADRLKSIIYKREKAHTFECETSQICLSYSAGCRDIISQIENIVDRDSFVKILATVGAYEKLMITEYNKLAHSFKSTKRCPFEVRL